MRLARALGSLHCPTALLSHSENQAHTLPQALPCRASLRRMFDEIPRRRGL
jgi:hypothetical protein